MNILRTEHIRGRSVRSSQFLHLIVHPFLWGRWVVMHYSRAKHQGSSKEGYALIIPG